MTEFAGSLYIVSTAAFAAIAGVVGVRLLLLSGRTGQMAERLLGLGVLLTACLGYGVMMIGAIGRSMMPDPSSASALYTYITTAGWICHNIGVMCVVGFVVHVFRHGVVWARALAIAMSITLWAGWALHVSQGGMTGGLPESGFWIAFVIIGTYPFWTAAESFVYYARMRKRVALGLSDQLVANRFLLWGIASLTTAGSVWVVTIPVMVEGGLARGQTPLSAICMLVTGILGIATVATYWLTFFPPAWYRRRHTAEAA